MLYVGQCIVDWEGLAAARRFAQQIPPNLIEVKAASIYLCHSDHVSMGAKSLEPQLATSFPDDLPGHDHRFSAPRLAREWRTIDAMIALYCRHLHGASGTLCVECRDLLDYARLRLERCRFGAEKPTCAKCPVHCYQRDRREQIKAVMRFAGPRMLCAHPILSLRHWLDSLTSLRASR